MSAGEPPAAPAGNLQSPPRKPSWPAATEAARGADGFSAAGKWLAGLCGVGAVLVCSYAISSYAAYQADPSKCLSQLAVSDAIAASRKLALMYLLGGVCALIASALPTWRHQLQVLNPPSAQISGPAVPAGSQPGGILVAQAIAIIVGLSIFCFATWLVWRVTGDVAAPNRLQAFDNYFQTECDARTAPASHRPAS